MKCTKGDVRLEIKCHEGQGRTGSNMPGPSLLVLAEGSMPRLPVSMDAASDRISPNMLPVTMVSKDLGFLMICMAALSTYLCVHRTFIPFPQATGSIATSTVTILSILHMVTASAPSTNVLHETRADGLRLKVQGTGVP